MIAHADVQHVHAADDQWITADQAARITGQSVRSWQLRAQALSEQAKRHGSTALARKAPPPSGKGKRCWYVHRSIDPRLALAPKRETREDRERAALEAKYPPHKVATAYRRARWLNRWRRLCHARRDAGRTKSDLAQDVVREAREVEGDGFKISVRSLEGWRKLYDAIGDSGAIRGVEALIDRRGDCTTADSGDVTRSPEAIEYFYSLYHDEARPAIKTCHAATLRKARAEGWAWPSTHQSTGKWLRMYDNLADSCLKRFGHDTWARRFMPHVEIDYAGLQPGSLFVCDHTNCDFWVEDRGKQYRPWLTAIIDCRSRCVVGWNLGKSPNQDAIIAALRMAFRWWAIPEKTRIDNGKDFTSKLITGVTKAERNALRARFGPEWAEFVKRDADRVACVDPRFTGIVTELGVELIYARPYAAWSKGIVERWFGTFHGQCGKTFTTYCGNSVLAKPECLEAIRRGYTSADKRRLRKQYGKAWKKVAVLRFVDGSDVPTLDQARTAVAEYLEVYHNTAHGGEGMNGATPLAVWNEATSLRRAEPDALLMLMNARGLYKVTGNGVKFKVGGGTMSYGASEPKLDKYRGRDVFITADPDDLSCCFAFTADRENRRFIARLDANERMAPNATAEEVREAVRAVEGRRKQGRAAQRSAAKRRRTVAQELTAQRREQVAEIRATGTDDVVPTPTIQPVRTGFEQASKDVQRAAAKASTRKPRDLSAAIAALSPKFDPNDRPKKRPRVSDKLLGPVYSLTDGREEVDGTDAGDERSGSAFDVLKDRARTDRS